MQIHLNAMSSETRNSNKNALWALLALGMGIGAALAYLQRNRPPKDDRLEERVRREFQRLIHHAKSVQLDVHDGVVTVSGPILLDEVDQLISCIQAVPGVKKVEDHLQAHPADKKTYLQ